MLPGRAVWVITASCNMNVKLSRLLRLSLQHLGVIRMFKVCCQPSHWLCGTGAFIKLTFNAHRWPDLLYAQHPCVCRQSLQLCKGQQSYIMFREDLSVTQRIPKVLESAFHVQIVMPIIFLPETGKAKHRDIKLPA